MKTVDLTEGSISRHIRDLALPASIGLFFQTMYNVVDTYYAGQESPTALAAVGLSFPVFLLILAAGGGLSRGASGLISNAIGGKKIDDQKRYTAQALSLGFFLSIAMTIVGLVFAGPIFQLLDAEGELLELAKDYIHPIFLGSLFLIGSNVCNAILSSTGDTRTFGIVLVLGFFLNLVLDPWFMKGGYGLPAMGVAGIAWATVVIQLFGCAFLLSIVIRRGLLEVQSFSALKPDFKTWRELIVQALPASFNIMSIAIGFFVVMWFLNQYGEKAIAAYAATTRIEQIGLMPTFGLYAAILALVGQNNGARKLDRVHLTMFFCNALGFAVAVFVGTVMFVFSPQLMDIFTDDEEVIRYGVTCLNIIAPILWTYVVSSTHIAMLQALKKPNYGFFESILRKIILPVPILWLLVIWSSWGIEWIWYCNAIINLLMTAITVAYSRWVLNAIDADAKPELKSAEVSK